MFSEDFLNDEAKLISSQEDLWRIFRIMAEFTEGFERMAKIKPSVVVFGSARTKEENKYYQLAVETSKALVKKGFGITTGGGPGIMQAANQGAREAKGSSTGINIELPHEQFPNRFIDHDKSLTFRYFFIRKVMMVKYAQGYVLFPGGFGTIDELFEVLTLVQTGKTDKFPIVLMGKEHWESLFEWIKDKLLTEMYISEPDMDLVKITDDPEETAQMIYDFHKGKKFTPNF